MDWLTSNKEWLFSGAGITVITIIVGLFRRRKKKFINSQSQQAKNSGSNIQAGNDVNITHNHKNSQENREIIEIASLEEIQKYDPRVKTLHRKIESSPCAAPPPKMVKCRFPSIWVAILLIIIMFCMSIYLGLKGVI